MDGGAGLRRGWPSGRARRLWRLSLLVTCLVAIAIVARRTGETWDFVRAAGAGNDGRVAWWLNQGMNASARSLEGSNALMMAAYAGHLCAVRLLLVRGASPDDGVCQAAMTNRPEITLLLARFGADLGKDCGAGETPLHLAEWHRFPARTLAILWALAGGGLAGCNAPGKPE